MPRLAFTLSTRALPVFTVGWAVVSGPRSSAKAIWCVVVEVVLAAEEEHLVLEQRRAHLRHDVRVQVAAEADALDHGADAAADLAHAHGGGRGDGGETCSVCASKWIVMVVPLSRGRESLSASELSLSNLLRLRAYCPRCHHRRRGSGGVRRGGALARRADPAGPGDDLRRDRRPRGTRWPAPGRPGDVELRGTGALVARRTCGRVAAAQPRRRGAGALPRRGHAAAAVRAGGHAARPSGNPGETEPDAVAVGRQVFGGSGEQPGPRHRLPPGARRDARAVRPPELDEDQQRGRRPPRRAAARPGRARAPGRRPPWSRRSSTASRTAAPRPTPCSR